MISDFEDDTHYCLKCHSTIIGLDNYVNHRKSKCGKVLNNVEEVSKPVISPQLLQPDEPFTLKADDFFSSLELQSSTKKISNSNTGGKTFNGVLTRSKASAVIQASNTGKDFNYLDHTKQESEWLTDHSMKNLELDNVQRPRHNKKDESNDTIFDDSEEESDEFDFDDEDSEYDEDDDNAPPRTFTGGKWKPTSSPIPTSNEYFWHIPPPHHTGAKWKPQASRHNEHLGGKTSTAKELFSTPPPNFTGSKWTPSKTIKIETSDSRLKLKPRKNVICETLPCESSVGKWIYASDSDKYNHEDPEIKDKWKSSILVNKCSSEEVPSPFYTKGKWKPTDADPNQCLKLEGTSSDTETDISPLRKSSGTVQYWCGPCNRRLASKIVYERHLKSELHFKRTLHDRELEDSPYIDLNTTKRVVRKITYNNSVIKPCKIKISTKNRRKIFVNCDVCNSRVNTQLIGKHLISHYHCLKGDLTLPESRQMVLDNIHSIVLQSPFQCSPCKFYCNTQEWFLHHWLSEEHKETVKNTGSFFWCAECKFQTVSSDTMYAHLVSTEHQEMISVINRSVPVVIKKLTPIKCPTCDQQFLYNIHLRKHCERENHSYNETGTDEYQSKHKCNDCGDVLKSKVAFQRHRLLKHREKFYICSVCSLNFNSIEDAKKHRRTIEHRIAFQKKRHNEGHYKDISKTCQYCSARFENIIQLKDHLKDKHPEYSHSCPHCGKVFAISQELTVHVRTKACTFDTKDAKMNECDQCQYKTDSSSEFLFHKVLHTEPFFDYSSQIDTSKETKRLQPQYKCPICEKFFVKPSLRCHLRIHTKERPYICTLCNAGFVRKSNWIVHMANHDRSSMKKLEKANQVAEFGARPFLCSTCGASFKRRSILQQHMTKHTGRPIKCHHPGCLFTARFASELKTHLLSHSDEKPFMCEHCDYQGKSKQQLERHMTMHGDSKKYKCSQCSFTSRLASHLKRHLRLHTGAKPFVCPHCNYCCNNLENLRKHVLSTNKHPGKCIYECKFCQTDNFETNFAKEFKVHLVEKHPETFVSGREAATYIAGIYEACNDGTSVQRFADDDKERSNEKNVLQRDEALSQLQDIQQQSGATSNNIGSTLLLTSVTQDPSEHKIQDELFPMLIVSKDVICIENPSESWNIGGNYDVEESGSLVPFHSEGESLFHEHFQ